MTAREPVATYLEQRESTETGDEAAGLSHSAKGLVLVHVQELAAHGEPVGGVTILHTAGDHGGRYLRAGNALADAGWAVALPDLRGHGRSEGERGHSAGLKEVVRDLGAVQDHLAYRLPDAPKVLVGVGLGAVYALAYATEKPGTLAALVLISPLLAASFEPPAAPSGLKKFFHKVGPTSPGRTGLRPEQLTSVADEQRAWSDDPLTHDVITLRASEQAVEAAQSARLSLADLEVPVLCLYGADDSLAQADDVRAFEGDDLSVEVFAGSRHDLLHDVAADEVTQRLSAWLAESVRA